MNSVNASSTKRPPAAMTVTPATWPAEVRLVPERSTKMRPGRPCFTAQMAKPKDTDRYPRPMGSPSRSPSLYPYASMVPSWRENMGQYTTAERKTQGIPVKKRRI